MAAPSNAIDISHNIPYIVEADKTERAGRASIDRALLSRMTYLVQSQRYTAGTAGRGLGEGKIKD
jgi:hypothetical protein